jgi:hypothetical protein
MCFAINDRCWWNGEFLDVDKCVSLERSFLCSELSRYMCSLYQNIRGLTIVNYPCFFNSFLNENGNFCVYVSSVLNCNDIKTNGKILDKLLYCDNARTLFGIMGKNELGCIWKEGAGCSDASDISLPTDCSYYNYESTCNYHWSKKGECFWNQGKREGICELVSSVTQCENICTNDVAGFGSNFCSNNGDKFSNISSEICKWSSPSEEIDSSSCNCKGIKKPEKCSDLNNITSPSECELFSTKYNHSCFFNGNYNTTNVPLGCSDLLDVLECSFFLDLNLCNYAKRSIYPLLEKEVPLSNASFLCSWSAVNGCVSKGVDSFSEEPNNKKKNGGAVAVVVVVITLLVVAAVIITLILWKKGVLKRLFKKIVGNNETKTEEMVKLENAVSSESFPKKVDDLRKGDTIGEYVIEESLGKGFYYLYSSPFFFFFLYSL